MKKFLSLSMFIALCCLCVGGTSGAAIDNLSADTNRELARARNATAKYHDFDRADEEGYEFLHCVEGEGLEYVNWSLVDCNFDIEHPEALHYVNDGNGLKLVGVEYVVLTECSATAPDGFTGDDDEWEFMAEGLPIWAMRAALWLPNPEGVFAEHNPRITTQCSSSEAVVNEKLSAVLRHHGFTGTVGLNFEKKSSDARSTTNSRTWAGSLFTTPCSG